MTELISYKQPIEPLFLPETIELDSSDILLLQALKIATSKTYEELIHTAIRNLYYKQKTLQEFFYIEETNAT